MAIRKRAVDAACKQSSGALNMDAPRFRGIAFDLLTALIDSWSLWIDIADDENLVRK